ncbi:hypothetical protein SNE40_011739 [Patella caerulea]|uniref:Coiled-coil domain-containing protein n=1 Tax=Patella caerulea TaxID=87958 RepID=A0AAN8JKD0_PATCE
MPKKFAGTNSKAAEARARKSAQKEEEKIRKAAAAEDELWRDDDKNVNRKLQRKDEKERKRLEQLEKKKEIQQLHDEEMNALKSVKPTAPSKVTRHAIAANIEKPSNKTNPRRHINDEDDDGPPIEENLNRNIVDGDEARTVEEAIQILGINEQEESDKHPEKRMKAAFKKFESERLPVLKRENPNLRLTQVKQLLQKEWMKSPDNPLVQML